MRRGLRLGAASVLIAATLGLARADEAPPAPSAATTARAGDAGQAAAAALPAQPDELVTYVTKALDAHDLDAIDRLVEWKGARPIRRRMTLFQIRYNFGRPIKSAAVETFPDDGLSQAKSELDLKPNLPVTERLRVVFDEPPGPDGEVPASVFLLGKENGVYRISLLLASGPPK